MDKPNSDRIVVLNVDDYEAGRYATTRTLRQAGYDVVEAGTGEEALQQVRRHPDLVVLDVNLPDVDGFEVCRRIKSDPATASIPVLYLSAAYRGPEHRVQGLDLGADGYLTQPVDPRELVATVNALLRAHHVRDAVRRSEERFRSLMTATSDILWTATPAGELREEQPDWSEFTGQAPEEYRGRGWLSVIHPDDRPRTEARWDRAVAARDPYEIEHRIRRHDGEYRYMMARAVPVLESDGSVREWVGAHTDITDRKAAEQALEERSERLQFLSDAANRLLLTADPREYIDHLFEQLASFLDLEVYLNYLSSDDGTELVLNRYHGIPVAAAAEIARVPFGEPVCGGVAERRREFVAEDVQHRSDPEMALMRSLGVAAYACYPLVSNQQLIGTLSFGTRSRSGFGDDELSLMQTVCNQVAVALERARLIAALQDRAAALEEANRAKSDFLATMSHELRTPLNAMVGYTDLLLMGVPDEIPDAAKGQVERIRSAAIHLTQLIEEVLTHARIEAGHDELHVEAVEPRALFAEVCALVEPLAQQKGLAFVRELDGTPERIRTDPRKLRQILLNLLGNAVKFTERGEVGLSARTDGGDLVIQVRDTGIGIEPAYLEKIFEPFWQVDATRTRRAGGTGLGLGVVRQLARRLGGDVWVRSEPGQGSRFTVRLPLQTPQEDAGEAGDQLPTAAGTVK
jgi:PAS domain S-box-containing protein